MNSRGPADYYAEGQWNVRCQECSVKCKSNEVRKRWDGLLVCWRCFEVRNPQDYVRGVRDDQSIPFSTSDPPFVFDGIISPPGFRVLNSYIFGGLTLG